MRVLVLTSPVHKDFVSKTIFPYNGYNDVAHDIHGFYEEEPYPFDGAINYDIGVSFMYQYKVPKSELDKATWFNFHPAPLPEYQGRNLCYHAIMNGETEFGATLHYMDENFDAGDIIKVSKFSIPEYYTAEDLSNMAIEVSKEMFIQYFPDIVAGEEFWRIPNEGGVYYKKEAIADTINLNSNDSFAAFIRAVTYKQFYPKVYIGGVTYKIVRDE